MVYCCVPNCKSTSTRRDKKIGFHEFPSDHNLKQKWLKSIARGDFRPNDRSRSSVVCSLHFTQDDYVAGLKRRKLKSDAYPTIICNGQKELACQRKPTTITAAMLTTTPPREPPSVQEIPQIDLILTEEEPIVNIEPEPEISRDESISCDIDICSDIDKEIIDENNMVTTTSITRKDPECQTDIIALAPPPAILKTFRDSNCQTNVVSLLLTNQLGRMRNKIRRLNSLIKEQRAQIQTCNKRLEMYTGSETIFKALENVISSSNEGSRSAAFLLEQVRNFSNDKPTWSADTMQECAVWQKAAPYGYSHVRKNKILKLPCKATLRKNNKSRNVDSSDSDGDDYNSDSDNALVIDTLDDIINTVVEEVVVRTTELEN